LNIVVIFLTHLPSFTINGSWSNTRIGLK